MKNSMEQEKKRNCSGPEDVQVLPDILKMSSKKDNEEGLTSNDGQCPDP
jgi:hypothetical protein